MSVSAVFLILLHWVASHPAQDVMLIGALASLLVKPLEKWPLAQKAAMLLAHAGVNLPALWSSLMSKAGPVVAQAAADEAQKLEAGK